MPLAREPTKSSELRRIYLPRIPVNKLSAAMRESTVCHHWSEGKLLARRSP